ncbi:MAG: lipopolysaccharide assembly protein LapA domain-containing protein [Kiloniellaceae bacterium]
MHYLYLIVTFLFLVVFVTFTAVNLQDVAIDFWPFEFQLVVPFALVLLGSLLTGFVVGAFLMWLRFGVARARARRAEQRAAILERELVELKRAAASRSAPGNAPSNAMGNAPGQLTRPAGDLKAISGGP